MYYPKEKSVSHQTLLSFSCLNNQDVISGKVSDHHPVVHHNVLFWNVMMQGNIRQNSTVLSYNNAFGLIETQDQYIKRLKKIAQVIAEISAKFPFLKAITLCEGPIISVHVNVFIQTLQLHYSMKKYFSPIGLKPNYYQPVMKNDSKPWGLFMFVDTAYKVKVISEPMQNNELLIRQLNNRFQLWKLTNEHSTQYIALAHFPFGENERVTQSKCLTDLGLIFRDFIQHLIKKYSQNEFIFCADFNFNPYLISHYHDRYLDSIQPHNSIILRKDKMTTKFVTEFITVDGMLLSQRTKQKYYSANYHLGLFHRLALEHVLAEKSFRLPSKLQSHDEDNKLITHNQKFLLNSGNVSK
jgi:hypothetical protein